MSANVTPLIPSKNLSTEEVIKAANELDEALLDEHETSLNKAGAIIDLLIKLVEPATLKKLEGIKSFKQYYEQRLVKLGISQSSFYRYKDAGEFCYSNAVEFTGDIAPSVMAIIKARRKSRARIWNDLAKKHGEIPTPSMIVEAIERDRINTSPDKRLKIATSVAQVVFDKLMFDNSIDLRNVLLQIERRTKALEADTRDIEVLSAKDLSELEKLVNANLIDKAA